MLQLNFNAPALKMVLNHDQKHISHGAKNYFAVNKIQLLHWLASKVGINNGQLPQKFVGELYHANQNFLKDFI